MDTLGLELQIIARSGEANPGSVQENQVLLAAETTLQPRESKALILEGQSL